MAVVLVVVMVMVVTDMELKRSGIYGCVMVMVVVLVTVLMVVLSVYMIFAREVVNVMAGNDINKGTSKYGRKATGGEVGQRAVV